MIKISKVTLLTLIVAGLLSSGVSATPCSNQSKNPDDNTLPIIEEIKSGYENKDLSDTDLEAISKFLEIYKKVIKREKLDLEKTNGWTYIRN